MSDAAAEEPLDSGENEVGEDFDPEQAFYDRVSEVYDGDHSWLEDEDQGGVMSRYLSGEAAGSGSNTSA